MTAVFPSLPGLDIGVKRTVLTSTGVQAGTSGKEQRASWWSSPKYEYEVSFNALRQLTGNFTVSQDEAQALSNFFTSLGGQFTTFYFTDPLNSVATALSFGAGDGSTVTFTLTDMPASRTNYLLNSQNQSLWSILNVTVTPGVSDSLGGFNASTITATASSGYCQGPSSSSAPGCICCSSIWARRRTGSGVVYLVYPSGSGVAPIALTPAWQRFSISGPIQAGFACCEVYLSTAGDAVDVAFGQIEPGTSPTSYIPTTSAPVTVTANGVAVVPNGAPALYRNDWQGNQLLYATSRTNIVQYSQNFTSWGISSATVTANTATAPDGTITASSVILAGTGSSYVYENLPGYPAVTGQSITFSLFVKTAAQIIFWGGSTPAGTDTYSAVALSGGWYRQILTRQFTTTTSGTIQPILGLGTVTAGTYYIWGAQVEAMTVPTSYIYTAPSAVTVTDYTLTGNTVTLAVAPLAGAALTWSGAFYYTCRFIQDNLDYEQIVIGAWKGDSLKLRTVK